MIFQCYLLLVSVSFLEKVTTGQKIIWEDEYTTTADGIIISSSTKQYNELDGESRTIKSDGDDNGVRHSISGTSNNELVSKRYYPQPAYPPPAFQLQYENPFSLQTSSNVAVGGNNNWEWSLSATTQQSRKPSFVQFPGENHSVIGPVAASSISYSSNSKRGSSSAPIRIDETCHCGVIPPEKDSKKLQRIVGGTVSKENSWPWMMGQTHCLRTIRNFGFSNVKLIMGTNNLLDSKLASYYSIRAVKPHPMYKSGTEDYDVALLEIKEHVNFTSRVSPICLKQDGDPFINRTATVAGWGSLQNGEGPPADLRDVDLKVVPNDLCQKEYFYNYRTSVTSSMLCAWFPGKDSCQGDSGGPLFLKLSTSPYAYTQIGIVSFGPPQCGATTIPGVYSRVSSSVRWIKSIARSGKFCKGSF